MKNLITYITLAWLASSLSAQLYVTTVPKTSLADQMMADSTFVTDVLSKQKTGSFPDFTFDGMVFTRLMVGEITLGLNEVIVVDYLTKNAADHNDFNLEFGVGDLVLFDHYGVASGVDSVLIQSNQEEDLVFWNYDQTKNIESYWGDSNHFLTYFSPTPTGNVYLIFVDDRGSTNPRLQDWNDGVFLATHFTDRVAVPEPSSVGLLAAFGLLGAAMLRRRKYFFLLGGFIIRRGKPLLFC
jgi:hypothetical protein